MADNNKPRLSKRPVSKPVKELLVKTIMETQGVGTLKTAGLFSFLGRIGNAGQRSALGAINKATGKNFGSLNEAYDGVKSGLAGKLKDPRVGALYSDLRASYFPINGHTDFKSHINMLHNKATAKKLVKGYKRYAGNSPTYGTRKQQRWYSKLDNASKAYIDNVNSTADFAHKKRISDRRSEIMPYAGAGILGLWASKPGGDKITKL